MRNCVLLFWSALLHMLRWQGVSGPQARAVSLLVNTGTAYTNMQRVLDTFCVLSCLSCLSTL